MPGRSAEMERRVNLQLGGFVSFQPDRADVRPVSGAQIHQIGNVQVFVINECGVYAGTGRMIDAEVVHLGIPTEEIAFLFVNHQLLNQFVFLHHVQM